MFGVALGYTSSKSLSRCWLLRRLEHRHLEIYALVSNPIQSSFDVTGSILWLLDCLLGKQLLNLHDFTSWILQIGLLVADPIEYVSHIVLEFLGAES